jgi:DNA repair protein RecO (recombination protein O)
MTEAGPRTAVKRSSDRRIDHEPGFVLHSTSWRETSLVLDVYTRRHGRMALVARGAKRPASQFRGLLNPFCPLALSWSGRQEIKTLVRVEWLGGLAPLRGDGLLAAFYVNELLVRLLARGDPHETLFDAYVETLAALAEDRLRHDDVLRHFELTLLTETGHAPSLERCAEGTPIAPELWYRPEPQRGLVRWERAPDEFSIRGSSVLALAAGDLSNSEAAGQSKRLLRQLIRYHLEGRPLNTRRIFQDLKQL